MIGIRKKLQQQQMANIVELVGANRKIYKKENNLELFNDVYLACISALPSVLWVPSVL